MFHVSKEKPNHKVGNLKILKVPNDAFVFTTHTFGVENPFFWSDLFGKSGVVNPTKTERGKLPIRPSEECISFFWVPYMGTCVRFIIF